MPQKTAGVRYKGSAACDRNQYGSVLPNSAALRSLVVRAILIPRSARVVESGQQARYGTRQVVLAVLLSVFKSCTATAPGRICSSGISQIPSDTGPRSIFQTPSGAACASAVSARARWNVDNEARSHACGNNGQGSMPGALAAPPTSLATISRS